MLITGNWYLEHTEKGNYYQPAGSELLTTKLIAMGAFWGWNLLNFTWNLEQGRGSDITFSCYLWFSPQCFLRLNKYTKAFPQVRAWPLWCAPQTVSAPWTWLHNTSEKEALWFHDEAATVKGKHEIQQTSPPKVTLPETVHAAWKPRSAAASSGTWSWNSMLLNPVNPDQGLFSGAQ